MILKNKLLKLMLKHINLMKLLQRMHVSMNGESFQKRRVHLDLEYLKALFGKSARIIQKSGRPKSTGRYQTLFLVKMKCWVLN